MTDKQINAQQLLRDNPNLTTGARLADEKGDPYADAQGYAKAVEMMHGEYVDIDKATKAFSILNGRMSDYARATS